MRLKGVVEINPKCKFCGKTVLIKMTTEQYEKYEQYCRGKGYVQDLDFLTDDEREIILSGICGQCFDSLDEDEGDN